MAIQVMRLQAGRAKQQGGKKAQPQNQGCVGMKSMLVSDGRNQEDDLVEP